MGCNVEKAKLEIYEILVKDQKKSDKKTVENIEKLAEDIASKLDNDIKSNFIMSKNKNSKNEKNGQINRYTDYTLSKNSLRENKIVIGEEDFKLRNPNFVKEDFLKKVSIAFTEIQNAWSNKDLKNVRRYISDSVYQRFNVQFQMMNKLEQIDKINNLKKYKKIFKKYILKT